MLLHLAEKGEFLRTAFWLHFMAAEGSHWLLDAGSIGEHTFTWTWAYDQVWSSLRHYSTTQAGGKEAYGFKQTGLRSSIDGFMFGPKGSKPVFALLMTHDGWSGPEVDMVTRSGIKDFFENGVQVAWELVVGKGCAIRVFRATDPEKVTLYRMGDIAEAEPALPGWRMAVSELLYHRDPGILSTNVLLGWNGDLRDLVAVPGKSEIIRGAAVQYAMPGGISGWVADQIFRSLDDYARRTGAGIAVGDNKAFLVDLPGRTSFSPNAAFYTGEMSTGYYHGAPIFAVEVRSGLDYSNDSYGRTNDKRRDYFEAGTEVVWEVDVLVDRSVRVYRKAIPDEPTVYKRGELAEAEPVLPGWSMPVDELFYTGKEH